MKKGNIEYFIEFIIDLVNEFDFFYTQQINSRYYFLNGGCYELYKVVKHYFPDVICVITKTLDHCGIFYNNNVYDANGKVQNPNNFVIAREIDIKYMEDSFGRGIKNLESEHIIEELELCSIK